MKLNNRRRRDQGLPYISDWKVLLEQEKTRLLVRRYNKTVPMNMVVMYPLLKKLLGHIGTMSYIEPPFRCDYGSHIFIGDHFFANYNFTAIDVMPIHIGDHCMIGPNVSLITAGHPIHPEMRKTGLEYGKPITIGSNVWIGGSVVVNPGITIGENVVIGSGSVVTKDIPPNVVAAGNPCRVIRPVTEEDKKYYYKKVEFDEEALKAVGLIK